MNGPEESKSPSTPEANAKNPTNARPRAPKPSTELLVRRADILGVVRLFSREYRNLLVRAAKEYADLWLTARLGGSEAEIVSASLARVKLFTLNEYERPWEGFFVSRPQPTDPRFHTRDVDPRAMASEGQRVQTTWFEQAVAPEKVMQAFSEETDGWERDSENALRHEMHRPGVLFEKSPKRLGRTQSSYQQLVWINTEIERRFREWAKNIVLEERWGEYRRKIYADIEREVIQQSAKGPEGPEKTVAPLSNRRVNSIAAEFDQFAGRLMHEAHRKLQAEGVRSSRHRETPDLPGDEFISIVELVDRERVNGKPKFPLKEVLTDNNWGKIAAHNQRSGNGGKKLDTLAAAAKNPSFKRMMRQRFNRAEVFYREKIVQQQP